MAEPSSDLTDQIGITRRYYAMRLIDAIGPSFVMVNNILFMQARGFSQFQINCWGAVYFIVAVIADVPMGALADAMGRRFAYVAGCMLGAASFFIYFFGHLYAVFLLAAVLGGAGDMMRNGAIDAWAVDELGRGFSLDRLFSRASQVMQFGGMIAVVVGGQVARLGIALPWLLAAGGEIVMAGAAMGLMRDDRADSPSAADAIARAIRGQLQEGLRAAARDRTVLILSIASAILMAGWAPFYFEWPQYFNSAFHSGPQVAGWIYFVSALCTMAGAEVTARRQPAAQVRPRLLFAIVAVQSAALIVAGIFVHHPWMVLAMFGLSGICAGASMPIVMAWLNEQIEGRNRATLLSFQSTCTRVGAAVALPAAGRVADRIGFGMTWQICGAFAALAAPCFALLGRSGPRPRLAVRPGKRVAG